MKKSKGMQPEQATGFVTMTAGADPTRGSEMGGGTGFEAGPRGDASVTDCQMGDGQKKRTVTSRDQSPYSIS